MKTKLYLAGLAFLVWMAVGSAAVGMEAAELGAWAFFAAAALIAAAGWGATTLLGAACDEIKEWQRLTRAANGRANRAETRTIESRHLWNER